MKTQNELVGDIPGQLNKWVTRSAITCAVLIGLGMFAISFTALCDLAVRGGIAPHLGWVWAVCIDGIIAASTLALVTLAKHPLSAKTLPWVLIIAGGAVSVAGNIFDAQIHAESGFAPVMVVVISAAPPLGLLALTQLVVTLSRRTSDTSTVLKGQKSVNSSMEAAPAPNMPTRPEPNSEPSPPPHAPVGAEQAAPDGQPVRKPKAPSTSDGFDAAKEWAFKQLAQGIDPTGTEVADRFGCSPSTARRWLRKIREEHDDSLEERSNSVSRLRAVGS